MIKSKALMLVACASLMAYPVVNCVAAETATQFVKGTSITADVKARLLADSDVKSLHISVKTDKTGIVTLSGYVHTDDQKQKAEQIASAVDGVKSVRNKLVVKPEKTKT